MRSALLPAMKQSNEARYTMRKQTDKTDQHILQLLEHDARTPAAALATMVGITEYECLKRVAALECNGHIEGYTIVRNYPEGTALPIFALIRIEQDPARTGHDLQRSMESIPEITGAEVLDCDRSVLIHLQVPDLERLGAITASFRVQSSVLSLDLSTSKPLLRQRPPTTRLISDCHNHFERHQRQ
jgi:DNA-binding Lrp family transcriptional regulator